MNATRPPYAIVTGDFVRTGGMDAPNFGLASYLAQSGRQVHLVAYRADDEILSHPNVTFHRQPKLARSYTLSAPLLASAGMLRARQISRQGGVVVVNGGNCPFPGVNWVHYVHAAFAPVVGGGAWSSAKALARHRISVATERAALRKARVVIATSERTRRDIVEHVGVSEDRVRRIYYGVDAARFFPHDDAARAAIRESLGWKADTPSVAFVGALGDRRKGFDVVYDAWRALCVDRSWDANLIVVGTGAELPLWRGRAEADGISHRVNFLGFRNDVPRVLAGCDALVSPTRYEAYGAGVHEALCCGLPAIVSSTAGVAERYPRSLHSLLLGDPNSADALVTCLKHWRDRAADLRAEVAALSTELRSRGWDDMARDIVALCEATH